MKRVLELMDEATKKVEEMDRITQEQLQFLICRLKECGVSGEDALRKWDEYRKRKNL